jgi:hypothetical protein
MASNGAAIVRLRQNADSFGGVVRMKFLQWFRCCNGQEKADVRA